MHRQCNGVVHMLLLPLLRIRFQGSSVDSNWTVTAVRQEKVPYQRYPGAPVEIPWEFIAERNLLPQLSLLTHSDAQSQSQSNHGLSIVSRFSGGACGSGSTDNPLGAVWFADAFAMAVPHRCEKSSQEEDRK